MRESHLLSVRATADPPGGAPLTWRRAALDAPVAVLVGGVAGEEAAHVLVLAALELDVAHPFVDELL